MSEELLDNSEFIEAYESNDKEKLKTLIREGVITNDTINEDLLRVMVENTTYKSILYLLDEESIFDKVASYIKFSRSNH